MPGALRAPLPFHLRPLARPKPKKGHPDVWIARSTSSPAVRASLPASRRVFATTVRLYSRAQPTESKLRTSPPVVLEMAPISLHHLNKKKHPYFQSNMNHRAFIALGSNLGDRVSMIEKACLEMQATGKIHIRRTSGLWETKAMYVLDQDNFVNGVCEIDTSLSPMALLDQLQTIEKAMGRVKIIDKGPRNIDLDILLFDNEIIDTTRLSIPHPLMFEREFVLRPLCELIPFVFPPAGPSSLPDSFMDYLRKLPPLENPISPLTPIAPSLPPIKAQYPHRRTLVMSIFNLTPDSFSDGGRNYNIPEPTLVDTIKSHIASGATIIDLGGQSTRPGAIQVSASEELDRVLPAIKLIRSIPEATNIAISVDTYRASVARASIEAGADIVNDVSAGLMDSEMLATVAELGCTVCLMHMRGTPETMNSLANYPEGRLVETVGKELLQRVREAETAGIRRWRIILDPGIGFAKTEAHNLELLRRLEDLRNYPGLGGLPWLVGTSRKAFVGRITGVKEAKERTWGTAAAVTAAIQGGADVVRVHDVEEMSQVARMADALWRGPE